MGWSNVIVFEGGFYFEVMGTIMLVMKCLILGFAVESSFASFEMMIHISIWHIIIFKLWAINYSNQNSQHRLRGEIAQIWLVMIEFASRQLSEDSKIWNRGVDWRSVPKSMCQESKVIPETPACGSKQVSFGDWVDSSNLLAEVFDCVW